MTSAAIISSPLQAVTLLEAVDASYVTPTSIFLAPNLSLDTSTRNELNAIAACRMAKLSALRSIAASSTLIVGDPYSQLAQIAIALARTKTITILEDGVATYRAMRQLAADEPLERAVNKRANWLLRSVVQRRIHAHLRDHTLEWVLHREFSVPPCQVRPHLFRRMGLEQFETIPNVRAIVAGSALAADGYVVQDRYLHWLSNACSENEHTLFIPHRRESEESRRIAVEAGAKVTESGKAFEQILFATPNVHVVHSLPTTPALTTQTIRPDVRLVVQDVSDWWKQPDPLGMREVVAIVHELLGELR